MIKGKRPRYIRAWLTPKRRRAILAVTHPWFQLTARELKIERRGIFSSRDEMELHLRTLLRCAKRIEEEYEGREQEDEEPEEDEV
jgi:hypothetical protein